LDFTFFVPLKVVTVSVTLIETELGPDASLVLGVPESTPAEEIFRPFGKAVAGETTVPLAHLKVVVYGLALVPDPAVTRITGP
jgi:hypothetical protein